MVAGLLPEEPTDQCSARVHWLPAAVTTAGILSFTLTFPIYFSLSDTKPDQYFPYGWRPSSHSFVLPTISRTGGEPPTSPIFTAGLHLMSFLYLLMVVCVHTALAAQLRRPHPKAFGLEPGTLNQCSLAVGLLCVASMFMTGTVYLGLLPWLHGVCASCLFLSANLYALVLTVGVLKPLAGSTFDPAQLWWFWHQVAWVVAGWALVLSYTVVLSLIQQHEECTGQTWCAVRNWKSLNEYLLTAAIVGYTLGLTHWLRPVRWRIIVIDEDSDSERRLTPH